MLSHNGWFWSRQKWKQSSVTSRGQLSTCHSLLWWVYKRECIRWSLAVSPKGHRSPPAWLTPATWIPPSQAISSSEGVVKTRTPTLGMYLQVRSVIRHLGTPAKSKYQRRSGRLAVPVRLGTRAFPQGGDRPGPASWESVREYHQLPITLLFTL